MSRLLPRKAVDHGTVVKEFGRLKIVEVLTVLYPEEVGLAAKREVRKSSRTRWTLSSTTGTASSCWGG